MSLDYWEFRDGVKILQEDILRENARTRQQMADAFTRVAAALETLTEEVRGLRADLNPTLDKPRRLQAPGGQ